MKTLVIATQGILLGVGIQGLFESNPRLWLAIIILNPVLTCVYSLLDRK
jgi:hypothetical protein